MVESVSLTHMMLGDTDSAGRKIVLAALFCVARHFVFKTEILSVIPLSENDTAQAPSVVIFLFLIKIIAEE